MPDNPPMLTIYGLNTCDTTRKALRYLQANGHPHTFVDIRNTPPSRSEVQRALESGLPIRRLFNTSGGAYRSGGYKDLLPDLSPHEALDHLAGEPMLIKRPLVVGPGVILVGFKTEEYDEVLSSPGRGIR